MKYWLRILPAVLAAFLATAPIGPAHSADSYPSKPITLVAVFGPGSASDTICRVIAQPLSIALNENVIVENRPGANGALAAQYVARSAPDGYTLLMATNSPLSAVPFMMKSPPYDAVKDFTPITRMGSFTLMLVVHPSIPATNMKELIEYAKDHPGKLSFASANTSGIVAGETLKRTAKIDITSVPYKGGAQAVADMLGGHIQMNFGTTATLLALIKQGKLRALAVTKDTRLAEIPDVATMAESGFPNLTLRYWNALWAPPHTPTSIVEKLNTEVITVLKSPEFTANMAKAGFEPMPMDVKTVTSFIASESPKALVVAKTSGVKGD
mgnify:CR=1 FL=1